MSTTLATLIFVPLAVWAMVRTGRSIAMLAATVGFSATAIVNVPSIPFGFQPYHLFGTIVIVRALLDARVARIDRKRRRITWVIGSLWLMWFSGWISFAINPAMEQDKFYMFSQMIHMLFGMLVAWSVSRLVRTPELLRRACLGFERGTVFIACWGLMQFLFNALSWPYPGSIFNNSIGIYVQAADIEIGHFGLIRVNSVATEPSFLGRTLVMGLAIVLVRHAGGGLSERRWMVLGALALVLGLLVSTSTTGLFGLAVLLAVGAITGRRLSVQRFAAVLSISAASVIALSPALRDALIEVTLNKDISSSANIRYAATRAAKDLFFQYPFLGVGFGNQSSYDLAYKILSNFGVVGAVFLCIVLFGLLVGRATPELVGPLRPEVRALKLALFLSVAMDWVAGWSYPYGEFWILAGLLLGAMTNSAAQGQAIAVTRRSDRDEGFVEETLYLDTSVGPPAWEDLPPRRARDEEQAMPAR